jgi:Cu-Zn family superoxide dismutase
MKKIIVSRMMLCLSLIAFLLLSIQGSCRKEGLKLIAVAVIEPTGTLYISGKLVFTQTKKDLVRLHLELLVPSRKNSSVAVHIHEHGMCGNMGGDAHGHWNPGARMHGKWGTESFHAGDIGNITLDSVGRGTLELETALWSIGGDDSHNILGRSIIVHGGIDNYSQPTGNSGPRIGCGVIERK